MPKIEIVCLANSRKHSGRCVAGLRLDGQGWIRPVSDADDGRLFSNHYTLPNGQEVAILDIVRLPLVEPTPEPFQPENWRLGVGKWQSVREADRTTVGGILLSALDAGPEIFGNTAPFLLADGPPPASSLVLVEPQSLRWRINTSYRGARQTRARFRLGGAAYDLVVTDPRWEQRLASLALGEHPRSAAGLTNQERVFFCISLAEPFENRCYKLVAGVIVLPSHALVEPDS